MKNCVKFEKGGLTSLKIVSRKDFRLVKNEKMTRKIVDRK